MSLTGGAFLHSIQYLVGLHEARTQTTSREREAIRYFASGRERAVEIGVAEGVNTRLIAEHLHTDGVLYAIDPFFSGRVGICWGKLIAKSQVRRSKSRSRVVFVEQLSWNACDRIDGTFDFLFIDGDHSWDGIERDWKDWSGRVSEEGVVLLHDTHLEGDTVNDTPLGSHQYFESNIVSDPRFELIDQVDSLSVIKRLP